MGRPESIPGLLDLMNKYDLGPETVRHYIQDYWNVGGADFDEFMRLVPISFDDEDLSWGRRVFSGQWSAMAYENRYK